MRTVGTVSALRFPCVMCVPCVPCVVCLNKVLVQDLFGDAGVRGAVVTKSEKLLASPMFKLRSTKHGFRHSRVNGKGGGLGLGGVTFARDSTSTADDPLNPYVLTKTTFLQIPSNGPCHALIGQMA